MQSIKYDGFYDWVIVVVVEIENGGWSKIVFNLEDTKQITLSLIKPNPKQSSLFRRISQTDREYIVI